jgi:prolyl-tRNA synthetase
VAETGRWDKMGPELLRLKDRHERDFAVQPTSGKWSPTSPAANPQLQATAGQFLPDPDQVPRRAPRFGIMRGREFTMKDAYSFDRDIDDGLKASYQNMYDAYVRIFKRFGLNSARGGRRRRHRRFGLARFHVIADTGEDAIVYCPTSDYAANMEAAEACRCRPSALRRRGLVKASTPGKAKCEHVAEFLNIPLARTVKSIVLATDGDAGTQIWLLLIRGDHELNEVKASKVAGLADFRFATESEIVETFGTPPGYLGPIGTKKPVKVVATAPSPT